VVETVTVSTSDDEHDGPGLTGGDFGNCHAATATATPAIVTSRVTMASTTPHHGSVKRLVGGSGTSAWW
jgi:hypothetical protein